MGDMQHASSVPYLLIPSRSHQPQRKSKPDGFHTYNQILGKYVAQHLGKISKYTSIYALEVQEQTT
jgi:hypothetical protein